MELTLALIEQQLISLIKAKNQIAVDTLRGLKTRIQNNQITKGADLSSDEIVSLVKSEIKRRKEASEAFTVGGRQDAADKELQEIEVLNQFLPTQMSETDLILVIEQEITKNNWVISDFGKAMGVMKVMLGNSADGAMMAKVLKEKLK